jgi:hypothetical protein
MKNIVMQGVLFLFMLMVAQTDVFGQRGRFGNTPEDSIRALRNLALYGDRFRQGNFKEALPYWRVVFKEFPRASRNIYIQGVDLMNYMIENAETEEIRKAYLDTAMMMFDQRIEYFGDSANVLGRKGIFYFEHNQNIEESGPGYEALAESIRLSRDRPSPAVIVYYMGKTVEQFRAGMVDNEYVIETYSEMTDIIDNALEGASSDALYNARELVENMFADSEAADCDALITLFGDRVSAAPEDVDLLNKVYELLSNANCTDSDLYLSTTERIHDLDPSPRSALGLAAMYRARNDNDQVRSYLKQAIELQDDPSERANYFLELAIMANQVDNDKIQSRQYALEALKNDSSLGRAHIHIGNLYASENNCFNDDFKNRTVYWAAVDRYNEAKRADPSLTAEANRYIEQYSIYFPDNETIFFHGYTAGETYHVACWINETTRIRPRQ